MAKDRDENLLLFATDRQREILEAFWSCDGSQRRTAETLGVNPSAVSRAISCVERAAARRGYTPGAALGAVVPEGYRVKGTSTLYDADGKARAQWVKTTEDRERQEELLREMVATFAADLPRLEPHPFIGRVDDGELLAVYPVGDHHLGLYAWNEEAGDDYDLVKAEALLASSFERLASALPAGGQALVVFLGDLFHYDGLEPVTPTSKNLLDADGRYALMIRTGIRLVRRVLGTVLERHAALRVIVQPGNHDPSSSIFLAQCLAAIYENEPRVVVDTTAGQFHYYAHGANLIGVCHGHEVRKATDLALIMAQDRPVEWGRTRYRTWLSGHIHQDRVVDAHGVRIESFRVLPPTDAWAHGKGYRSAREMKALLLHTEHGEVQRVTVNPEMFAG